MSYVIVFRSRLRPGVDAEYGSHAERIYALAQTMPGFTSAKDFVGGDGERLALIEFDTAEHLAAWRDHPEHRAAQELGRAHYYTSYAIQICKVERGARFDGTTRTAR